MARVRLPVTVVPALVLHPGDRVLINFTSETDVERVHRIMAELREKYPDVEFTAIGGVSLTAIRPGSGSDVSDE